MRNRPRLWYLYISFGAGSLDPTQKKISGVGSADFL